MLAVGRKDAADYARPVKASVLWDMLGIHLGCCELGGIFGSGIFGSFGLVGFGGRVTSTLSEGFVALGVSDGSGEYLVCLALMPFSLSFLPCSLSFLIVCL